MKYIIYKITNEINGKIYIGFTSKTFEERFTRHCIDSTRKTKNYFQRAICKYGKDNFSHEVIYETFDDVSHIKEVEIYFIKYFNSNDRAIGYNQHRGGSGGATTLGRKHSNETKKKIGLAHLGSKRSEEAKLKMRGRKLTEEQKKTIGDFHRGKKLTIDQILFLKNRIVSEETRQKLRNKVCSEETRQKISEANKGKKHSEETKKKMREREITEETKHKQSNIRKGKYEGENNWFFGKKHSEETKKKIGQREYKKGAENHQRLIGIGKKFTKENHPLNKSITINNIVYPSISEASRVFNIGKHIIYNRIKKYGTNLLFDGNVWSSNINDVLDYHVFS